MHEYGIVRGLLAQIDELVRGQNGRRAVRVILGVTGATAAEERLLRDAFEAFKADTTADQAELVLERAPLDVCCLDCGSRTLLPAWQGGNGGEGRRCPQCGGGATLPIRGQDFCLKSIEIEV